MELIMKSYKIYLLFTILLLEALSFSACSNDDDDNNPVEATSQLTSLSSPYLICANRNPGGVGFDFYYNESKGGANNLDSLTVEDFDFDVLVKTIQAEKTDGSLSGMPYIALSQGTYAINYSSVDTTCKGLTAYNNLTYSSSIAGLSFETDATDFNISALTTGSTGKPLLAGVQTEYNKLVIGQKWKTSANNDVDGDELVWIVKPRKVSS